MTLLVCERCELFSLVVCLRKGFHDGARRAEDLAVTAVEPLEAVEAADTEPWLELDCRGVSGDDWKKNKLKLGTFSVLFWSFKNISIMDR